MSKRIRVLPYRMTSMSSRTISRHFEEGKRVYPNRKYVPKRNDLVINWGHTEEAPVLRNTVAEVLNQPRSVKKASSKTECLTILNRAGVPVPSFATNQTDAARLFQNTDSVYCRTLTRSSKGKGIVIAGNESELVRAPLYTGRLNTDIEYRVHIFRGRVIDIVQKRRMTTERLERLGITERNPLVRNRDNGWSFTRTNIQLNCPNTGEPYHQMIDIVTEAMLALELDFAAIDLIKTPEDDFYVLEVNTAPGMEAGSTTHRRYVKAFAEYAEIPYSEEAYNRKYEMENTHGGNLDTFLNTYYDE